MTEEEERAQTKRINKYLFSTVVVTGFVSLIFPVITCLALYVIIGGFLSHSCNRIRIHPILILCSQLLIWIGGFYLMLKFADMLHYHYRPWSSHPWR